MTDTDNTEFLDQLEHDFSPTMCTAKWLQSTISLQNGNTHSCCHTPLEKVSLDELQRNPTALHNTERKKAERQELLDGKKPPGCGHCWNVENISEISTRHFRNIDPVWSKNSIDRIKQAGSNGDIVPSYIEVSFSNLCNFKCAYCSPDYSSKWAEEIEEFGFYPTTWKNGFISPDRIPSPNRNNQYVEAFWKWFVDIKDQLHVFRITGGEPLLSKHTWRVIDEFATGNYPHISFGINSNMDVDVQFIDKLIQSYNLLSDKINDFVLYTSLEATGREAEYVRYGLSYDRYISNVERYLNETGPDSLVHFIPTVNALSITTFDQFLLKVYSLRQKYGEHRISLNLKLLRWPIFMEVRVIPRHIRIEAARRMKDIVMQYGNDDEKKRIEIFWKYMNTELPTLSREQKDFYAFFKEYDRRRGTNFKETFPQLIEMFEMFE